MEKISIAIAQSASIKGDIDANVAHHKRFAELAAHKGSQVIIFPELSLTGYEPELAKDLVISINDQRLIPLRTLAHESCITIVVGAPVLSTTGELNIGALCLLPNYATKIYTKQYLHPGEELYFSPGTEKCMLKIAHEKIALAICADISNPRASHTPIRC